MKIIHCADLHLDARMSSNFSREQAKERRQELLRTFVHMADYATMHGVRIILISGDLFDTRNVSALARNTVRDVIVSHPQIDFLYLRGNHDNDNFLSKLKEVPPNLKLFGERWSDYTYGSIVISGLELTKENQAYAYHSLVLPHNTYNIVMLHGQLSDYQSKNRAEVISLNELKNKNIDYLALGHVHTHQSRRLDNRGVYCYPGCLEGRGFDECGEKGFVLLDIDEETLNAEAHFVSIASRTIYTLPVELTGIMTTNEAAKRIEEEISRVHYPARSIVKIQLTGELDVECELNCDYLEELFADYFYLVRVENATGLLVRYSDYEKDASLKGEFIRTVLASDLEESQKTEVIRCGLQALSGEEI